MKQWQRRGQFQGMVLYERCLERIVLKIPHGEDDHDGQEDCDLSPEYCPDTRLETLPEDDVLELPTWDDACLRRVTHPRHASGAGQGQQVPEEEAFDLYSLYHPEKRRLMESLRLVELDDEIDDSDLSFPHHSDKRRTRTGMKLPELEDDLNERDWKALIDAHQGAHSMPGSSEDDFKKRHHHRQHCPQKDSTRSALDSDVEKDSSLCAEPRRLQNVEGAHPFEKTSERELKCSSHQQDDTEVHPLRHPQSPCRRHADDVKRLDDVDVQERRQHYCCSQHEDDVRGAEMRGSCSCVRGLARRMTGLPGEDQQDHCHPHHVDTERDAEDAGGGGGGDDKPPTVHAWYLVDADHRKLRLPRTMLFLGREECDIIIQSGTVDKRHAVITFDLYLSRFKVKDLSTTNGTYVNESRIPEQEYVTLNHMDSIRLGYDTKVYHMEQGEPCGDSPPPPPLPLQPPPSVMEGDSNHKDNDQAEEIVEDDLPDDQMAECQGCIAEQKIEHTCTHAQADGQNHHHHQHHHHHHDEQQFVDKQRRCDNVDEVRPQPEQECEPEPEPESEEQPPKLGRNTWPRKKLRQMAHVASIFDVNDDNSGDDNSSIMVESGRNYFVSVDDSVCDRGRLTEAYNLSRAGSVQRILRNSKQPLPPELETVKKGTPLYGQPSWWGEDTENNEMDGQANNHTDQTKPSSSRPCSLGVDPNNHLPSHPHHPHRDTKAVYMEIPHQPGTPERDKPVRDRSTPARSVTSSLSKDSLVLTPDSRERSLDKDFGADNRPTPGGESNPALSFTVDFGDEKKPKLKSGASLSQFVPPKIRNSLSRSEKTALSSLLSSGKVAGGSRKNSEERDMSPTRQKRLEDSFSTEASSKGKSTRRSSGQGTGVASLRTADFASESQATDRSREARKDGERRLLEAEKELDKKPPKSPKSQDTRKASPRGSSAKPTKSKSHTSTSAAAIAASVHAVQYADSASYLIDRMFAGTTGSSEDSPRSDISDRDRGDSPSATEHAMYKEAREYDRASQRGSLTYRAEKPPLSKQKSLSKSPANVNTKPQANSNSTKLPRKSPVAARKSPVAAPLVSPKSPKSPLAGGIKAMGKSPPEKASPRTPPHGLPEAPSPIGGDQEDKVSEAGTYTIEAEEDDTEEMMARQQIDEVFGVDVDNFSFERPNIGSQGCLVPGAGEGRGEAEDEEAERTLHEDDDDLDPGARTPCDEEDENIFGNNDDQETTRMSGACGEEEVPSWINQLQALTAATRAEKDEPVVLKSKDDSSKKGTQGGLSRKRPGTGRKLPSIPGLNDNSPVSSEHSGRFLDNSPSSPASTLNGSVPGRLENGLDRNGADSPSRTVNFSSVVSRESTRRDSPWDSEDLSKSGHNGSIPPKTSSTCSRGSIDTELLLRDTETVMAAMEARMGFRSQKAQGDGDGDSDTDVSSTVAMVNGGDDDHVKPTKYHSPRENMTRKSSKDKDNSNIRIPSTSSSSRKPLLRSYSEQKPGVKSDRSSRSGAGVSVVSDVLSRDDSLDQSLDKSFASDFSDPCSDRTDSSFTRSGSRGKGTISLAKPNRAFALRRARADGTEVADAVRGRSSASSPASSRRSSSNHGTSRTPHSDRTGTGRSEASLGGQIARKARENSTGPSKPRESSTTRGEGARRNSLRGSSVSSTASSIVSTAKKERDIRTLRTQLKTGPAHKDLAITGISSRSQSQPGSRSNSPKAAERMAWKRRKEYDPRKAVAEAKAKPKEPRPKPKVQYPSLYKNRMTRSASFTNNVELSGRVRHDTYSVESPSSVEDLSSAATAADSCSGASFRRAFIPFHNTLRSDRLHHSADEDEAGTFPPSQASVGSSKPPSHPVSLKLHKSAFTPPLSKLQTPSPDSPPSTASSLLLRRRTLGGVEYDESGASTAPNAHRTQADSHRTQPTSPQSYDSLIVSSIYQLSLKLKTTMDKTLNKLSEQDRVSITPSPIDDFLGHPAKSDIPAWKSANQELAGVLKNLRKMEHHLHMMERALFPDDDTDTDVSGMSTTEKLKYFQEIERIRGELAGFQPIDTPESESHDPGSPEMAELSKDIR